MNKRFATVLLFALVVSAAASFFLYQALGARFKPTATLSTIEVPVARGHLEVGAMIKDIDLTTAQWPGGAPPDALLKKEEIIGRGVISAIYAGEPIRADRLASIGAGAGLAATIPLGKRAMAIRVNDVVGVAGFVTPGQKVDLLILGADPNTPGGTVSKTLLQNISILSAGQQIQQDAEGKPIPVPVVNVLVSPDEAEIVSLASTHAQIQLVLRNPLDKEAVKTHGALFGKLFSGMDASIPPPAPARGAPRPAAPKPAPVAEGPKKAEPPPNFVVEILNGTSRAQIVFKQPEAK